MCLITTIVGCICQVSHGRPYVGLRITSPQHTVDKNGMHLKNITFSCIKLNYEIYVIFIEYTRSCYANIQ